MNTYEICKKYKIFLLILTANFLSNYGDDESLDYYQRGYKDGMLSATCSSFYYDSPPRLDRDKQEYDDGFLAGFKDYPPYKQQED